MRGGGVGTYRASRGRVQSSKGRVVSRPPFPILNSPHPLPLARGGGTPATPLEPSFAADKLAGSPMGGGRRGWGLGRTACATWKHPESFWDR